MTKLEKAVPGNLHAITALTAQFAHHALRRDLENSAVSSTLNPPKKRRLDNLRFCEDPTDPNILYLQYGNDYDSYGLCKTNDGGANWDQTGLGGLNGLNALVIDPTTPATLYAATNSTSGPTSECALMDCSVIGGVQQSTDGGATWNFVGLANQDVSLLAIDPLQPNVLYAVVTSNPRGLFKSTDSGASWSPINNGLGDFIVNALIVDPDQTNVLYLATSGYGVFKSSDGGATWAQFNDGLTFLDVRSLAIVRGASPAVYAGTPGGVFRLVDRRELGTQIRHREQDAKKY